MTGAPQIGLLPDGRRLHLQHGPIDLIVEAFGARGEVEESYRQAWERFKTVLDELVAELPALRRPADAAGPAFEGRIARRMAAAAVPLSQTFVTPMAAVAGAVADGILEAMVRGRILEKAYVNNGGDIALHLGRDASFKVGVVASVDPPAMAGRLSVRGTGPVRGVATSGRHGRSLSLGIADAVTVLADTAAAADVAATLIANAVDLPGHPAVTRAAAHDIDPDSDLGGRLVTVAVGPLGEKEVTSALDAGCVVAEDMHHRGLIRAAALCLNGIMRLVGGEREYIPPRHAVCHGLETEVLHA